MDFSTLSDESLLALIARRRPEALEELYRRYSRMVYSLAIRMVAEPSVAEEITLDVFTRVWDKADSYRASRAQVNTWLTRIARNHAIDTLRRQNTRAAHVAGHWTDAEINAIPAKNNPEETTQLQLQRARVRAAVAQLPDNQRQALSLAFFGGYTHHQIAQTLNQPLGTVKTRIRSALKKLRHILSDDE
ncbi:MAG: sigma-70 family RNA polymerase sigma factor [Chloroflexi bacterium]|nr:MAG: sigma-70 family RNA polymerase sigma factor [Chloroflexota bacterium]